MDSNSRVAFAREKFRAISRRYDFLIKLLSLGLDEKWRSLTIAKAGLHPGDLVLDVATGTGDLAFRMAQAGARAVGIDFCLDMLLVAKEKARGQPFRPSFCLQRAEELAFRDNSFDACTMGVALRHMKDPKEVFREMARVAKPGGRIVITDYSVPQRGLLGSVCRIYFFRLMPLLGWLLTFNRDIYVLLKYLPCSITNFLPPERIVEGMQGAGLKEVEVIKLGKGAVFIYRGLKAAQRWAAPEGGYKR